MNKWIVVTTINEPTKAIKKISILCENEGWSAVVVGDLKTPKDWSYSNIHYLSPAKQNEIFPELSRLVPSNHYCRKNLGYLYAINQGAECILETDDDNIPYDEFGKNISKIISGRLIKNSKWANVYKYFTNAFIWPRGLPLDYIHSFGEESGNLTTDSPIQQYLADEDPDVDAIYRLLFKDSQCFYQDADPVILDEGVWCPFNSQNTIIFPEVFPLLYLPCFVSFRMTDIWRSFVAQAGLWFIGKNMSFLTSTVKQERNEHDLMKDFSDEVSGYLENDRIVSVLENVLASSDRKSSIGDFAKSCWYKLVDEKIIPEEELKPAEEWFKLIKNIQTAK